MTKLNELPRVTARAKKRRGRGYGSGKGGHTVGRGQKGQKSRGKIGLAFEGTKIKKSLLKRLPLLRGKGKLKPQKKPIIINLAYLNLFPKGSVVDIQALVGKKIVGQEAVVLGVKILGDGKLNLPLTVALPVSGGARKIIEKAGGKVIAPGKATKSSGTKKAGKIGKKASKPSREKEG